MPRNYFTPESLERRYEQWRLCLQGGEITCRSPGAAVNERQMMYRARMTMRAEHGGISEFDHLVIRVQGAVLEIGLPTNNVLKIKPIDKLGPDFKPVDTRSVREILTDTLHEVNEEQNRKLREDIERSQKPIELE